MLLLWLLGFVVGRVFRLSLKGDFSFKPLEDELELVGIDFLGATPKESRLQIFELPFDVLAETSLFLKIGLESANLVL